MLQRYYWRMAGGVGRAGVERRPLVGNSRSVAVSESSRMSHCNAHSDCMSQIYTCFTLSCLERGGEYCKMLYLAKMRATSQSDAINETNLDGNRIKKSEFQRAPASCMMMMIEGSCLRRVVQRACARLQTVSYTLTERILNSASLKFLACWTASTQVPEKPSALKVAPAQL